MPDDTYYDDDFEVYDDYEEHVDFDEHERARAYTLRKNTHEGEGREHQEAYYDEYRYGEDSGEAFEKEDAP